MQGELATARAEANEMKIRAKEADEMAKMEKMRRESEEKLRLDATEREKKVNKRKHSLAHTHARTQRTQRTHATHTKQTCCHCMVRASNIPEIVFFFCCANTS